MEVYGMSVLHTSPRSSPAQDCATGPGTAVGRAQAVGGSPAGRAGAKPRTPQKSLLRSTAIAGAPKASLAPPAIPRVLEEGVLGYLDPLTLLLDALVASLAPPAIPRVLEKGVLGHLWTLWH